MLALSSVGPLIAIASLIAGVVGAFVGVRLTAASAKDTAEATARIVQDLGKSVAVLQVQVAYLADGLKSANVEMDRLRDGIRATYQ